MISINRRIRTLLHVVLVGMGLIGVMVPAAQGTQPVIRHKDKNCFGLTDHDNWSVGVSRAGSYCIAQDLHQARPLPYLLRMPHQSVPMGPLIDILRGGSNITIDLLERHLSSEVHTGIQISDGGFWPNGGGKVPPYRDIKIMNGNVSTSKQATVFMVHAWNDSNRRFYHRPLGDGERSEAGALADYGGDISQYGTTEYILENLTLESDNIVIIMQGKKNVIRHCKIIGGNGTVNLYGPNMTFEDNEIILNAKDPQKEGDEPAVALYLEDAQDSVIRNNRITIKGRAAKTDAIVLKKSTNVVIEGNTISGTPEVFRLLDNTSSVKATGNTIKEKGW